MADAVPNPVEGTLVSVSRDACQRLGDHMPYTSLDQLLETWDRSTREELEQTPNQLVVDGVKILEKAGVVDSGARGFAYFVQGMFLASQGQLPEAFDPVLFQNVKLSNEEELSITVDHTVTDTKFRFCTEGVVLLKDDVTQKDVLESMSSDSELGDSVACVGAPAKEGGKMVKIHIHSNNPEAVFEKLRAFSRDPILKKEKAEDMLNMKEQAHEDMGMFDLTDAKFTIMGLCDMVLPPCAKSHENFTLPVFMVPSTTLEPIDIRFATDSETCNALNCQRHQSTAIRYTTAAPNPMQVKIELLAALSKGLPVLVFLMSKDKRISALGRNVCAAISMLSVEQQSQVRVLVHGWGFQEAVFLIEAMRLATQGKTIDEAHSACEKVAAHNFIFASLATSATVKKLLAWRPGLFPEGFTVEDGQFFSFGLDPIIREGDPLSESQRAGMLYKTKSKAFSMDELEDMEVQRIKSHLKPGQKLADVLVPCVGRPDFGHRFVRKLQAAQIPIIGEPIVYTMGFFSVATSGFGEIFVLYKIVS